MKFSVDQKIFTAIPRYKVMGILAQNIEVSDCQAMLQTSVELQHDLLGMKIKENPDIIPYREAMLALGINPNKYMASIEALLTRISKGKGLGSINPIVDLGNAISLKYHLPIGAHDLDSLHDELVIRPATPLDHFIPFGSDQPEALTDREIVYVSGHEVRTRMWIWRQSELGKITASTRNVFFPIDGFTSINDQRLQQAQTELAALLKTVFHADVSCGWVDQSQPELLLK